MFYTLTECPDCIQTRRVRKTFAETIHVSEYIITIKATTKYGHFSNILIFFSRFIRAKLRGSKNEVEHTREAKDKSRNGELKGEKSVQLA